MKFPVIVVLVLLLAGCASKAPPPRTTVPAPAPGAPAPVPSAPPPEPPRPALAAEQQRLAALFEGTPVVFVMQADGSMRVEVPLRFSFDAGSSTVKPPLAAVLDRIATSQRRGPSRLLVVAPGDKRGKGVSLGSDRATSARDYLVGHGIAATRFVVNGVVEPEFVRIVVSENGAPKLQP